jgi:hypothetical protein
MARLEGAYEQVGQRLTSIDLRLDGVERKIDALRDAMDTKIDSLRDGMETKIDQRFMWTIGIVLTTWLTTIASIIASIYVRH